MRARVLTVSFAASLLALAACSSHEPYCTLMSVHCVEACGEAPFIQCGGCPDGAIPADECPDGGP